MSRALRLGDIFQLRTPKGFAYIQYSYMDDEYGHLVRILPGVFNTTPSSFSQLSQSKELFFVFFPLAAAVSKGIVTKVAGETIPASAQKLPTMRRPGARDVNGRVLNWWIRDSHGEKKIDKLNGEQKSYSLAVIWNNTILVERICSGWRPEMEF